MVDIGESDDGLVYIDNGGDDQFVEPAESDYEVFYVDRKRVVRAIIKDSSSLETRLTFENGKLISVKELPF